MTGQHLKGAFSVHYSSFFTQNQICSHPVLIKLESDFFLNEPDFDVRQKFWLSPQFYGKFLQKLQLHKSSSWIFQNCWSFWGHSEVPPNFIQSILTSYQVEITSNLNKVCFSVYIIKISVTPHEVLLFTPFMANMLCAPFILV